MAHARKKTPIDPPEVVAIRERMKPVDRTVAKATPAWLEEWEYGWFNQNDYRMAEIQTDEGGGWVPISKKKDKDISFPYAVGNNTDDYWHNGDTIACKRPRAIGRQREAEKEYYNRVFIEQKVDEFKETAGRAGLRNPDKNIEFTVTEGTDSAQITTSTIE